MTHFDPPQPSQGKHPLLQEAVERELIAFHLHELSPEREQALRQALDFDPGLRAESTALAGALAAVADKPEPLDRAVLDHYWQNLRPALHVLPPAPIALSRWRLYTLGALAVASAAAVFVSIGTRQPGPTQPYHHDVQGAGTGNPVLHTAPHGGANNSSQPSGHGWQAAPTLPVWHRASADGIAPVPPAAWMASQPPAGTRVDEEANRTAAMPPDSVSSAPPDSVPLPAEPTSVAGLPGALAGITARPQPARVPARGGLQHSMDVALTLGANTTNGRQVRIGNSGTDAFTSSAVPSAQVSFHQQFRKAAGYRLALSYTRQDYRYVFRDRTDATVTSGAVPTGILEMAATYVALGPHGKRISTAGDAGAGVLQFIPLANNNSSYRYAPAAVAGASADYEVNRHWTVRLAYRAQVFRTQEFEYSGGNIPVTKNLVVSHEPTIGIAYRFGGMR